MAEKLTPKQAEDVLELIDEISKCIEENQYKVPYHLNLIDEMHINENGHSRILYKILQYQNSEGQYIFLKSLFKYIADHYCKSFGNISVNKPEIDLEKCRIDLWVRDEDYAVIFENKIYDAKDQDAQIATYIEKTKIDSNKYRSETTADGEANIFVVYLPQRDNKDPEPQTWGKYFDKEIHRNFYAKTSFRSVILPWLKEKVLPEIPRKDKIFKCAIVQYIDYLEGLFKMRKYDKKLNIMVDKVIKKKLQLGDGCFENNEELSKTVDSIEALMEKIETLRDKNRKEIFKQWETDLTTKFDNHVWEISGEDRHLSTKFKINNRHIIARLYFDGRLCFGLEDEHERDTSTFEIIKNNILGQLGIFNKEEELTNFKTWYGWKYIDNVKDWRQGYDGFCSLIMAIDSYLPQTENTPES